jgi:hypothetical protein
VRMFGQKKAAPKAYALHEFVLELDRLVAAGRAGGLDIRNLADLLDTRATTLRSAWVAGAPVDASMH